MKEGSNSTDTKSPLLKGEGVNLRGMRVKYTRNVKCDLPSSLSLIKLRFAIFFWYLLCWPVLKNMLLRLSSKYQWRFDARTQNGRRTCFPAPPSQTFSCERELRMQSAATDCSNATTYLARADRSRSEVSLVRNPNERFSATSTKQQTLFLSLFDILNSKIDDESATSLATTGEFEELDECSC